MSEASKQGLRRLGSYTTARVEMGRVMRVERHALRLRRDARRLDLAPPSLHEIETLFRETAAEVFPASDGIIRLEWSRPLDAPGRLPDLVATTRAIGGLPATWRARIADTLHPGPETRRNTKAVDVTAYDASREEMRFAGVEEVLLFQAEGWLVEGCRSNILLVQEDGAFVTPDLALGGVEGLGLEILRESRRELRFGRIDKIALRSAREIMAVNAVRGVVPIIELDGSPIGDGAPGPTTRSLALLFGEPRYSGGLP